MKSGLKLSETEYRSYMELFNFLDGEGSSVLSTNQVYELFVTSALTPETLTQVFELCGAKEIGSFGKQQFFSALKLIAAAQNGVPLLADVLSADLQLPLPRFSMQSDIWRNKNLSSMYLQQQSLPTNLQQHHLSPQQFQQQLQQLQQHNSAMQLQYQQLQNQHQLQQLPQLQLHQNQQLHLLQNQQAQQLPQQHNRQLNQHHNIFQQMSSNHQANTARKQSAPVANQLNYTSHHSSINPSHSSINPSHSSINQSHDSAFHDLKTAEKNWASFEDNYSFQKQQSLQQEQLQYQQQQKQLLLQQQQFYQQNFLPLDKDKGSWTSFNKEDQTEKENKLDGKTDGGVDDKTDGEMDDVWMMTDEQRLYYVKQFQSMQSDLTKTLSGPVAKEFFEKSKLPVKELSKIWQLSDVSRDGLLNLSEFCTAMHLVVLRRNEIELPSVLPPSLVPVIHNEDNTPKTTSPPHQQDGMKESPSSSSMSSPGNKNTPVNFEFKTASLHADPSIVHPVALRVSPEDNRYPPIQASTHLPTHSSTHPSIPQRPSTPTSELLLIDLDATDSGTNKDTSKPANVSPLIGRPRPTPVKPQTNANDTTSLKKLSLQSSFKPPKTSDSEVPPPPPPRLHSRNSSLDTKLITLSDAKFPPSLPPRPPSKEGLLVPEEKLSAKHTNKLDSLDRRDLEASIGLQKERNLVLSRVNSELNQELQEVMEQRIALEIQMEHLQA